MKTKLSLVRALRVSALVVLLAGLAVWARSGARLGWTQTSVVTLQRDEITGIDFPVRRNAFVAGIEVPLLATVVAIGAAGLSLLAQRRTISAKA
jgi:ABC-type transporter Mla subunit MlaD